MSGNGFFDVPHTTVLTTRGEVDLPMLFYDVSVRQLNFFIDYHRALPLFKGTGLVPCRTFFGKAIASLIFYRYKDVSIGPYDEVTITIVARPESFPAPRSVLANLLRRDGRKWTAGAYVLEMPVTIPEARAAGREIWGYPKFETEIPFRLQGREFSYAVLDPENGEPLLKVRGREGPGIRMRAFDLVTFSNHDGRILKTVIDVDAVYRNGLCRGLELEAGAGSHRLAANVRALGLDRTRPFALQSTDEFRSRLNPGTPVEEHPTPPLPYAVLGETPARPLA
jgi:hypothetical protein